MKYTIFSRKQDEITLDIIKTIKEKINLEYDEENPDIVITVGGDGTILRAVHKYINLIDNVVFFGVKSGHLGFYTNFTKESIPELCEKINKNSYEIETHNLLKWETNSHSGYAINEITITNPVATQIVDVYVDDNIFETVRGTGLCISTTNGSTAYNKSLNGPVVDHSLECIILTEIASLNSNAYRSLNSPLVLSTNRTLELKSNNTKFLTSDHLQYELDSDDFVKCILSKKKIKFAKRNSAEFIDRIKKAFL